MAETVGDGIQDLALTWSGRALDVGRIEAELGKLRYMAAGEPRGGQGFAMRSSFLNMVVYAEHEETAANASRIIEDLASHHPSRALVVIARPGPGESHIEAELAAHCHISQGEQSVCCEEVTLRVAGAAADHLHSVIVPLLIPDLPVYVWWTEELPPDTHLLDELVANADRLIVDSVRFADQMEGLLRLQALASRGGRATTGDLSWERLSAWRGILRSQQQIAAMRHHLTSVKSVEIRYAGEGEGTAQAGQALLFLAWLATELGWDTGSVSAVGPQRLSVRADDRPIEVYVHPVKYPAVEAGWLVSVKVACQSETARALLTISRTGDPEHVTIRTEHKGGVQEDHVRMERFLPADMLTALLDAPAHARTYNQILDAAAPLIRAALR